MTDITDHAPATDTDVNAYAKQIELFRILRGRELLQVGILK
jgi:hypothetical protein